MLVKPDEDQLFFQVSTNLDQPRLQTLRVPMDRSIAGWVYRYRQPLIVDDPSQDPRFFEEIQEQLEDPTRSILAVPLVSSDNVIGVLEAINKRDGSFNSDDQELLLSLAAQAGAAITNARLFAQSDLIAEMVHELRTPLASLNAAAYILLRPELSDDQRRSMVKIIETETSRLSEMATSFLDLARLESGRTRFQFRPFDPYSLLEECVNLNRAAIEERNLSLDWQLPEHLPSVSGDRDKVKQVFLNLLNNALKYNRDFGRITLKSRHEGEFVWIAIKDTGPGIPAESLPHVFEKFYRVPGTEKLAPGTGLGLSICKKIIEAHGGRIVAESSPGQGATFSVSLPVSARPE